MYNTPGGCPYTPTLSYFIDFTRAESYTISFIKDTTHSFVEVYPISP